MNLSKKSGLIGVTSLVGTVVLLFSSFLYMTQQELTSRDITENFIRTHLLMSNGGVRTNFKDEEYIRDRATGSDVLSESQGLLMNYAVLAMDEYLFAEPLNFLENRLSTDKIISYRFSEGHDIFPVNAVIDDLRIIRTLENASAEFNEPEYRELAQKYSARLYETNVVDNLLCDFYDTEHSQAKKSLTLCYADLKTIALLGEDDERWNDVLGRVLSVVKNGYISNAFPLFASSYDHSSGLYTTDRIQTVQSLITAVHLSELKLCPKETIAYVKKMILDGELYGAYDGKGTPLNNVQSTAIYALASILGKINEDYELQSAAIRHMLRFQITDKESSLYGAFANAETQDAYSFDNLYALLALAQYITTTTPLTPEPGGEGDGGAGCSAGGYIALALLGIVPFVMRRK